MSENGCDVDISLNANGKCKSFEKGFSYYFYLALEALKNRNYINMIDIQTDPDIRIGLYYVTMIYGLELAESEYGTSRYIMLKDDPEGEGLNYEQIRMREMNTEMLYKLYDDFNIGILPHALEDWKGESSGSYENMIHCKYKGMIGAFIKDKTHYRVYGEFSWESCDVYDAQEEHYIINIPQFHDMKVVTVINGEESPFAVDEKAVYMFHGFLTALLLKDEAYIPLYVKGELLRENAEIFEVPACTYKNFEVPQFLYLDGELYALFLCTDQYIFYVQDDVTLCYTWDKKRVSDGLIADVTLKESEENLETGKEKLIWRSSQGLQGKLLIDFEAKGKRFRIYGTYDIEDQDDKDVRQRYYIWMDEEAPDGEERAAHLPVDEAGELDPQKFDPEVEKPWQSKIEDLISKKPYFYGLKAYTVVDGEEEQYVPTGSTFRGHVYTEEDMIWAVLSNIMLGNQNLKKLYLETDLQAWINCITADIAYADKERKFPKKIWLNAEIMELYLVSTECIFYGNDDAELVELSWELDYMADGAFAEEGMTQTAIAVKNGEDKILWTSLPKEYLSELAEE